MNGDNYKKALKLAKKAYQSSVYSGDNPYILALDDLVERDDISSEVYLGLVEIPLKKIVGTKTHSRSTAFAKNFMPLLAENTEFALKWDTLSHIHLDEGIRDPIKVYEYLNRYYVLEGNKRASVLKFFDAVSISAVVTRLVPKRNLDSIQNRIYYEFLAFYRITGVNYVWFSREGSFEELLKVIDNEEEWDIDFSKEFKQLYNRFRRLYKQVGGNNLKVTTGDAFLEYIKIYGYHKANLETDDNLKARITRLMPELILLQSDEAVDVLTEPVELQQKKSLFSSIISRPKPKKIKVAFVYAKTIYSSGWTFGHELGRNHLEEIFGDNIETSYIENIPENNDAYKHIKKLVKAGNDVIITTAPTFINATLKAALEYPDVKFLNCTENLSYKHLRTYYGRLFEAKFLTGVIAGILTKTDIVGYVANYPIAGVISGINAFALGARFVNPNVKIKLIWSRLYKGEDIEHKIDMKMLELGADLVSSEESIKASGEGGPFGLYALKECDGQVMRHYTATPIWHWGIFYEKILGNIFDETWDALDHAIGEGKRAINYWWGLSAGVVDILYSNSRVPDDTKKLVEFLKEMICKEQFHPFRGPVKDQGGSTVIQQGDILSNEEILNMNWLVEGIDGDILDINDNGVEAPIIDILGVKKD